MIAFWNVMLPATHPPLNTFAPAPSGHPRPARERSNSPRPSRIRVASSLAEAFRSELPCTAAVASVLASLARETLPRLAGTAEDSEEDLVLRLRDPRVFGAFVESIREDPRVPAAARKSLIEHVFDLLPLPRTEGEVIAVETRAPRNLLALASSLAGTEGLSVLHVMHLVYAVFLDRSLVSDADRTTRSAVLHAILGERGSGEGLRVVYAGLHLASVPEPEAVSELRRILSTDSVAIGLRRSLASLAAAEDGGRTLLTQLAQREGLLPEDLGDLQGPAVLANIPRLPERLTALGHRFLERLGPV